MLFRMSPVVPGQMRTQTVARPEPPDRADLLPPAIGRYTGASSTARTSGTVLRAGRRAPRLAPAPGP